MLELTYELVKELLDYNPDTGRITRTNCDYNLMYGERVVSDDGDGYLSLRLCGKKRAAHRVIWLWMTGVLPNGQIDHINHNKSDNRWVNLRTASPEQNAHNQPIRGNNKSGVNGVYWDKVVRKWKAQIKVNYKMIYLGSFDEKTDAVKAREAANKKYGFHENHGEAEVNHLNNADVFDYTQIPGTGVGRKSNNSIRKNVTLFQCHIEKLKAYKKDHGLKSESAELREMIDNHEDCRSTKGKRV